LDRLWKLGVIWSEFAVCSWFRTLELLTTRLSGSVR